MPMSQRVFWAVIIVLLDLVVFFIPFSAIFLAYVLLANPPWFRDLINGLDGPPID